MDAKLESLRTEKLEHEKVEREKKMSEKYHMIKFFERKKLTRMIKHLEKKTSQLGGDAEQAQALHKEKESLMEDLTYVLYFPKGMKYVALFASDEKKNGFVDDVRSKQLYERAKALASASRQECILKGETDLCAHAMTVEYSSHKSKKENQETSNGNHASQRMLNSATEVSDSAAKYPQEPRKRARMHDEADGSGATVEMKLPKESKKKRRTDEIKTEPEVLSHSQKEEVAVADKGLDGDAFFLEESSTNDNENHALKMAQNQKIITKNLHASHKLRRRTVVDDGTMSKQELRLRQWQENTRHKKMR